MAEPLAEFGHIGFDAVEALVEPREADAKKIWNLVSHRKDPTFRTTCTERRTTAPGLQLSSPSF